MGAAFSRDLPGQSRLKTAPTTQKQQIQNYKVSFPIRLDARGQRRRSYETTFQKLELVLTWATLYFVGWVELAPCFVGFRCTQPNLHFAGVIAKPNNGRFRNRAQKVSFLIRLAVFLARGGAHMKLHEIQCRFHEFY